MRWQGGRRSGNVEDGRGRGGGLVAGGGIGAVVVALVVMLLGGDPGVVLQGGGAGGAGVEAPGGAGAPPLTAAEDTMAQFVSVVLAHTEDTWSEIFRRGGQDYPEPRLRLFSGAVQSACGFAQAAVGPFYCPADQRVYIDLTFYEQLRSELGAPGDFAQAYVIAHEVGHHVQTVTGISEQVARASRGASQAEANELSVRQELQADCYAGVWAYHLQRSQGPVQMEPGDVEEGLRAASAIGDDTLQRRGQGHVQPESFTHGSSEQRVSWLRRGMEAGDPDACDTFSGRV